MSETTNQAGNNTASAPPGNPSKPIKCMYPNQMTFTDDNGKVWVIYMPRKDYKRAMELYKAKNYAELTKFPPWANQQYTEEYYFDAEEEADA
ncbi:uncharacterized protein K452DRAFT_291506 [Aplosporella prunicola CBS 121167]|uniref:Uncharacterized protein n=1 Tax=Aplosporella prunicola CBS 121167 TaxID=1176127 RepID=A0A6A6B3Z6_9PEZI|nr:uncharacterized protein K452DRAFT_291506 [Aplosporella prunicola CBS 121167]KAF2137461.1 hypothetical protein K452DRAFT_291506 [Aplosporella prunicola CBS 121167]